MIYRAVFILCILFTLTACKSNETNQNYAYQIQGINAYKGQDVSSLFDANGAPNTIKRLEDNRIMWVYYTNYRSIGGGELISYDNPPTNKMATACMVKVILDDNIVQQIFTNCS